MNTRRSALKSIAAAALGLPAAAQHRHADEPVYQIAGAYTPKVFRPDEMKEISTLVDLIIPRTETPGAADAQVPAFIDRAAFRNASLKGRLRLGIQRLNDRAKHDHGARFDALIADEQVALLTQISEAGDTPLGQFFKLMKDLTIDGYYTSKEGLNQELGWNANTYVSEFKGCTHAAHQA